MGLPSLVNAQINLGTEILQINLGDSFEKFLSVYPNAYPPNIAYKGKYYSIYSLDTSYGNLVMFLFDKKILLGISDPDKRDLNLIIKQFPHIKIQLPINDFWDLKEQLDQRFKRVNINSIFTKLIKEKNDNKNDPVKFWKDFFKIVEGNSNYRLVLGINSINSVEKLKKIISNSDNITNC